MIDVIKIGKKVMCFPDIAYEDSYEIMPTVTHTCREIYDRLRDKENEDDRRIIDVCVYLSYYRILLGKVLSGDVTDSVKAGDITVSQSPSLRLEWAATMRDEALLNAYPLLKDSDFVFRQV